MHHEEYIYTLALTFVPGIGPIWARNLIHAMGSAQNVFTQRKELPKILPGIPRRLQESLANPDPIEKAKREYDFILRKSINCMIISDESYPQRLKECDDAPVILFFKGNTNLNNPRVINMVGTRKASDYGKQLCNKFVEELKEVCPDILIISGLAYGIDIASHRAALERQMSTVGVLAHGLDRIYPQIHRKVAIEMIEKGGLLTEFPSGTQPDRYNFVSRNRIVAGMSDATIVVESARKGGSLITADLANSYHRECFAFPGRTTDQSSSGCNRLIADNKACLIESAEDFLKHMGWLPQKPNNKTDSLQKRLFPELSLEEQKIANVLQNGNTQINSLVVETDIPIYRVSSLLFEMEMKGMVRVLAGGIYQLSL